MEVPHVSTRYETMLAKVTDELREKAGQRGLYIDDGDTLVRFNQWDYFRIAPINQLKTIAKSRHIENYTTMGHERLARRDISLAGS